MSFQILPDRFSSWIFGCCGIGIGYSVGYDEAGGREKYLTGREIVGDDIYPVSYTHLDVYKRQEVDLAGNEFENPRMIFSTQGLYMDCLLYTSESRYSIYQSLAGEYETFICDSAIVYANRALYEIGRASCRERV